ncbi:hypothetical protein Agub_g2121 [Astrephomene gubernaculifera]|uniref:Nuclear pore complex protein n=1 Tax=Astrephomene gubernaculifera TaxID=47775 RepID=A0AAD3HI18_9CHLO|nr:hypothetical protein Agub_g2121 [Astrephomene gubernaculifera]
MDVDLPGLGVGQQRVSLEEELTSVFTALLSDSRGAKDAVVDIYNVCHQRAEALRAEASEQLHRPARHMTLMTLAEEMEAQAATWQLVFCLYCDEAPPAGVGGGGVIGTGGAKLYRERLADSVKLDPEQARCARVVSWLESLADDCLRRQAGAAFAPEEGLWHETKTEMRAGRGSVVSELDPDAPGRTGRPLHAGNARSQERILARVWQLMRAGRLPEALELCQHVGQPWRAAALGGGGQFGALPVGSAAIEHDQAVDSELQAEELADEVTHGSGTLLALWRWAAQQAASAPPGDKFERAVFGGLGGSIAAMAPACSSWEDFAWAYCRSWLESQLMRTVPLEPHATGDLVAGDVVASALARCGIAPATAQRSVEAAMSVVLGTSGGGAAAATGGPPLASYGDGSEAAATASRGFGQLFAQHVMAPGSLVHSGSPAVQALRQVQGLLVQGDMSVLAGHLHNALVERRNGGGGAAVVTAAEGGGEAVPSAAAMDDGGADGLANAVAATNPERRWRMCALAAHMLLALEGLGVVAGREQEARSGGATGALSDPFEVHKTLELSQQLLVFYVSRLLERGQLPLVPPYLCALRTAPRSSLCGELLALHTRRLTGLVAVDGDASAAGGPTGLSEEQLAAADSECFSAFASLDEWFRRCVERQQQPPEELASRLATDIRPNELRIQLATFALSCRNNPLYGPHQRSRVTRWLTYPYIAAVQQATAAAAAEDEQRRQEGLNNDVDGGGGDAEQQQRAAVVVQLDPMSYYDVLDYANCLCCELALGDDVTAAAGHVLFEEVLPEGLDQAAFTAAESLAASAAAAADAAAAAAAELDAAVATSSGSLSALIQQQQLQQQAAAEAAVEERLAVQLRNLASELSAWRLFFGLDAQLARWWSRHEALTAAAGQEEGEEAVAALVQEGGELLQAYLEQLLQVGWQQDLASPARALAAAAAAASDGAVRVTLTVTSPPGAGSLAEPSSGAAAWGQQTAPYPVLQGAALLEFQLALQAGLQREVAQLGAGPAVDVVVAGPAEAEEQGQGLVTVSLAAAPEPQSWQALVGLVCSAVRGGLEGAPRLLLVGMEADRATSLAVCRRCCLAQAVLRCAALRLSLVTLGADADSPATGPQLLEMLAASPEVTGLGTRGSAGAAGLLDLLTQSQLQHVLAAEADTAVQHLRNQQQPRRWQQQQLQEQQRWRRV